MIDAKLFAEICSIVLLL